MKENDVALSLPVHPGFGEFVSKIPQIILHLISTGGMLPCALLGPAGGRRPAPKAAPGRFALSIPKTPVLALGQFRARCVQWKGMVDAAADSPRH